MSHFKYFSIIVLSSFSLLGLSCTGDKRNTDYSISAVSMDQVQLTDSFWSDRLETNRSVTIPHIIEKLEETERLKNFELAAAGNGNFCTIYPFDDTDAYKLIEAASYELTKNPDPELDEQVDSLISSI